MTVSSNDSRETYSGDGSTTVFAYTFRILDEDHIRVTLRDTNGNDTVQTITTEYTVSGVGESSGGNITMVTAPASGETLVLDRDVPFDQNVDYTEGGDFPAETHEEALDKLTMIAQQLNSDTALNVKLSNTSSLSNITVPDPGAGKYLKWNDSGTALVASEISTNEGEIEVPVTIANGGTGATTASGALTNLGGLGDLVDDTTPQLGADLDTNSFNVQFDTAHGIEDDSGNEQLYFTKTASAVNYFNITNAATGNNVIFSAAGDDTNIGITFTAKGTGAYTFTANNTNGAEIRLNEDTDNGTNYIGFRAAPSIASNFTLTWPSADGTANQYLQTDGSGTLSFADGASSTSDFVIKSWAKFNGTGTAALSDSYNVTSLSDNGTGDYELNLTTAHANTNYVAIANAPGAAQGNTQASAQSTTIIQIDSFNDSSVRLDKDNISVISIGDQ